MRERDIFDAALDIADPAARSAYLDKASEGNPALRQHLDEMLALHAQLGSFLEAPAPALIATVDDPVHERPGKVIGPYKLLEEIGEGGMGLVFVAEQHEPIKRRVALKIIKPGMDSRQLIARFEAERQALALMDHPHIAKVFDGGTTPEGRPYFAMELVKGTPITEYCDRHRLTNRQRLHLFLDVCHAVQHAHLKGIIHRDLKPSNILVSLQDVTPVVKVIDFGIAKATSGRLTDKTVYTGFAQMVGSPLYMSPEQAGLSDSDVDTRSDVYSLGVLLYELLTGKTPFDSEQFKKASDDEMRQMIREDEPPRPSTRLSTIEQAALSTIAERRGLEPRRLSQQVRGELDWIVMKSLEKDRNRRYESATAFAADVRRYLEDEPVQACPPSLAYRFRKFARRNKVALVTAGLVATSLVIGTAVSVWQAIETNGARKLAGELLKNEQKARHEAEVHFQKALNAVKRIMEVGDDRVAALPQMKETRQRLMDEALTFYTDLIASNPAHSQAYVDRGQLYRRIGKWEQARADCEKAIECDPENAKAFLELGLLLNRGGGRVDESALPYFLRAMELQPTNPRPHFEMGGFYVATNRPKEAVSEYRKAAELFPPGSAEAYLWLATACQVAGDPRVAIENYEKCLSVTTSDEYTHFWAHHRLGDIHDHFGQFDRALAEFTKAIDPPRVESHLLSRTYGHRGDIYLHQKNYAAALSDYNRAIELPQIQFSWVSKRRGSLHFYLQHYEEALADIAKAVELKPDDLDILTWIPLEDLASCPDEKFRMGMLALADKTIEMLESNPDTRNAATAAYGFRAALYLAIGKLDQGERLLRDFLERVRKKNDWKSDNDGALAQLGRFLLKQEKDAAAEPLLRECLAIRERKLPDNWRRYNAMSLLGGALLGQKKYAEAEPLMLQGYEGLKQRESQSPGWFKIHLAEASERLARLYEATNHTEKGKQWRVKLAEHEKSLGR